jgi:hypothetical protein
MTQINTDNTDNEKKNICAICAHQRNLRFLLVSGYLISTALGNRPVSTRLIIGNAHS